ncbi:MAG: hypothetical protein RRZ65_06145, partial [Tannerellaceae bacterium]
MFLIERNVLKSVWAVGMGLLMMSISIQVNAKRKVYTQYGQEKPEKQRLYAVKELKRPLTKVLSSPLNISRGLQNRHIALWQSHGLYYQQAVPRWEWQRARLFGTVEDMYTQSFVLPYLVP